MPLITAQKSFIKSTLENLLDFPDTEQEKIESVKNFLVDLEDRRSVNLFNS